MTQPNLEDTDPDPDLDPSLPRLVSSSTLGPGPSQRLLMGGGQALDLVPELDLDEGGRAAQLGDEGLLRGR